MMRKFVALAIVLAFVIVVPASTLAKGKKTPKSIEFTSAAQFCDANGNLGYGSFGECMSIFRACYGPGNSGAVCVCKQFQTGEPQQFYVQYNNLDECVNFMRHGYVFE